MKRISIIIIAVCGLLAVALATDYRINARGGRIGVDGGRINLLGPLDSYTKLLLHCDNADAVTSFIDEAGKTITTVGGAQIDTAQKQFGTASGLFDGTGDYLTTPTSADFKFGSGAFTIDFWVYLNEAMGTGRIPGGFGGGAASWSLNNGHEWVIFYHTAGTVYFQYNVAGVNANIISSSTNISFGWHHFAFVNAATNFNIYVNGTSVEQVANITISSVTNTTVLAVGTLANADPAMWKGWIDEFRISKGIARWTNNFTPPIYPYSK